MTFVLLEEDLVLVAGQSCGHRAQFEVPAQAVFHTRLGQRLRLFLFLPSIV